MYLYEYSSAYYQAESDRFDDVDSENTIVLEMCVVAAEEELLENLPEEINFQTIKDGFQKFYEQFVDAFTIKYYWDFYDDWAKHEAAY